MGTNTLNNRSNGETILDTFFNDIHQAADGDFVGRNGSGVPTPGQNLGTVALPWGTVYSNAMILNGSAVDPSQITVPPNIVLNGKTRSTSNQPAFIIPNGASASFIVDGTPTNLNVLINGVAVSVTTDITVSSLSLAPSINNTALVNDTDAADQNDTKIWGEYEHRKPITIDTVGSNISALVGKYAAFKIAGVSDEYFIAFVKSATELSNCYRGFFYDSASLPVNRTGFSNNDVITLMKLGFIFLEDDATTVDVTYTNPTWDFVAPTGPSTGDYWYDMDNATWKRYSGASWDIINRTYIGMFITDTTACIGARCNDFYAKYSAENTIELEVSTTSIIKAKDSYQRCNVAGESIEFYLSKPDWNITTELAASADMYNATEQASTYYYMYLKDDGNTVISDIEPYWRGDFFGWYHPHNPWRCIGDGFNNSGSNLTSTASESNGFKGMILIRNENGYGSTSTNIRRYLTLESMTGTAMDWVDSSTLGALFTVRWPGDFHLLMGAAYSGGPSSFGICKNETEPTVAVINKTVYSENISGQSQTRAADVPGTVGVTAKLRRGDVVVGHESAAAATATYPQWILFSAEKV